MSREASYGKTKLNNRREDAAIQHVLASRKPFFQKPDPATRKKILELLGATGYSSRVFDLVSSDFQLPELTVANVKEHLHQLTIVEVKATEAPIADENLHGFFFGATENEYRLAKQLGQKFRFCFVVLYPPNERDRFFTLLSLTEVEAKTRTKRIQYQVNFKGKSQV